MFTFFKKPKRWENPEFNKNPYGVIPPYYSYPLEKQKEVDKMRQNFNYFINHYGFALYSKNPDIDVHIRTIINQSKSIVRFDNHSIKGELLDGRRFEFFHQLEHKKIYSYKYTNEWLNDVTARSFAYTGSISDPHKFSDGIYSFNNNDSGIFWSPHEGQSYRKSEKISGIPSMDVRIELSNFLFDINPSLIVSDPCSEMIHHQGPFLVNQKEIRNSKISSILS